MGERVEKRKKEILRLFNQKIIGALMFGNCGLDRMIYVFTSLCVFKELGLGFHEVKGENSPDNSKKNELKKRSRILFST